MMLAPYVYRVLHQYGRPDLVGLDVGLQQSPDHYPPQDGYPEPNIGDIYY